MRAGLSDQIQCFLPVGGQSHDLYLRLSAQYGSQTLADNGLIIDNQYAYHLSSSFPTTGLPAVAEIGLNGNRQLECGTLSFAAADLQVAADETGPLPHALDPQSIRVIRRRCGPGIRLDPLAIILHK